MPDKSNNYAENSPDSGMFPPKVSIVILNWNGKTLTIECLRSLLPVQTPGVEFIVVDNGSTDDSVEAIRELFGDRVVMLPMSIASRL